MVKKFDLISPVYEKAEIQMIKNESEFSKVLNLVRMSFFRALNPSHLERSGGDEYLRRFEFTNDFFRISIDPKNPEEAQRRIEEINGKFERCMSQLSEAVFAYQMGLVDDNNYLLRNQKWTESARELSSLIDQFAFYSKTDLNELTKGIRSRSWLSRAKRLELKL